MQAGELVGHRQLQRIVEVRAQEIGVALALDLGAHPRGQLLRIDGPGQEVIDPDLQRLDHLGPVVRIDDDQHRHIARRLVRTQLGGKAKPVEVARIGVDDHQVDGATRGQQRLFLVGFNHRPMVDSQFRRHPLGLALVVVDDQHPAARAAQAFSRTGHQTHAAAGIFPLAQFVHDGLQARQTAHP